MIQKTPIHSHYTVEPVLRVLPAHQYVVVTLDDGASDQFGARNLLTVVMGYKIPFLGMSFPGQGG
ncbi:hypothetical protein [Saccharopolyspora spinosa]|uniref:hypothetical protein n=1 Tax=Saccharopolyspora spinosa TaxID=60894 RepID=UPI003BAAC13B